MRSQLCASHSHFSTHVSFIQPHRPSYNHRISLTVFMFLLKSLCTKGFYFNNHCFVSYIMFTVQHDKVRRSILANRIKTKGGH